MDHTQREEKMAQVRLANWAADLQRSLQNERLRFEALARSERAVWLTERLGECVQDGSIVPLSRASKDLPQWNDASALVKPGTYSRRERGKEMGWGRGGRGGGVDRHDPLGLLMLNQEIGRKGWMVLKVVSGMGVLGGLAFWVVRAWHWGETMGGLWQIGGLGVRDWYEIGAVDWGR